MAAGRSCDLGSAVLTLSSLCFLIWKMGITFIARPTGWCRAPKAGMTLARLCHVSCAVPNGDLESGLPLPLLSLGFFLHPERPSPLPGLCPRCALCLGLPSISPVFLLLAHRGPGRPDTSHARKQSVMAQGTPGASASASVTPVRAFRPLGLESAWSHDHL